MAIIRCSNCRKQISNKHTICKYCGYILDDQAIHDRALIEQSHKTAYRNYRKQIRRIQTIALILVLGFVGSFFAWWFAQQNHDEFIFKLAQTSMTITVIAYLGIRVWQLIIAYRYNNR